MKQRVFLILGMVEIAGKLLFYGHMDLMKWIAGVRIGGFLPHYGAFCPINSDP